MNRFLDGGILIVMATALLFALSIANFNAYLSELGLEVGFVLRNSHQILYNSLFVILVPVLKIAIWGIVVLPFLYWVASIYTTIVRKWTKLRKLLARMRYKKKKVLYSRAEKGAIKLICKLCPAFFTALVLFWCLVKAENMGTEKGAELLNKIKDSNYQPHEVVSIKGFNEDIYVIACGINNCGGIGVNSLDVVYFENKFSVGSASNTANVTRP